MSAVFKLPEFGTPERVEYHLRNWARWMRRYEGPDWYPSRTLGTVNWSLKSDFDGMCERMDATNAEAVDELIAGFSPIEQAALHNVYLSAVFRSTKLDLNLALGRAKAQLGQLLKKRSIL